MTVYIVCFVAILIAGMITNQGKPIDAEMTPVKAKIYLWFSFGLLAILCGLRSPAVGADSYQYMNAFYTIGQSTSFIVHYNAPVYTMYNKILYFLLPNHQILYMTNAIITYYAVAKLFYRFSNDIAMSMSLYVLSYFFFQSMNTARQALALSFMLIAIIEMNQNKLIKTIIFALLAIGVHNTVIILFPIVILMRKPLTLAYKYMFMFAFAVSLVFRPIYAIFVRIFVLIFPRYHVYFEMEKIQSFGEGSGQGRSILLTAFYLCVMLLCFIRSNGGKDVWLRNIMVPCFIAVIIGLVFSRYILIMRIYVYFQFFFCCAIPLLCSHTKMNRSLLQAGIFIIMIIPFWVQAQENHALVIPYQFFWQT